jgi:ribosome assembly protein YihI (activator of Der GTPase)
VLAVARKKRRTGKSAEQGSRHEENAAQSAFVEATIVDPTTGSMPIYRPLIIDQLALNELQAAAHQASPTALMAPST